MSTELSQAQRQTEQIKQCPTAAQTCALASTLGNKTQFQ